MRSQAALGRGHGIRPARVGLQRVAQRPRHRLERGLGPGIDQGRAFLEQTGHFIAAAAPAYRACRWEQQDAANRAWVAAMTSQLADYEAAIAPRLAALYGMRWPGEPMDVDVVATVSWAGANSYFPRSSPGHLLVSSVFEGREALEILEQQDREAGAPG